MPGAALACVAASLGLGAIAHDAHDDALQVPHDGAAPNARVPIERRGESVGARERDAGAPVAEIVECVAAVEDIKVAAYSNRDAPVGPCAGV